MLIVSPDVERLMLSWEVERRAHYRRRYMLRARLLNWRLPR